MAQRRRIPCLILATLPLWCLPAAAQTPSTSSAAGSSWLSSTWHNGYVGLNLGRSRYSAPCTGIALLCDDTDRSVHLYAGSMANDFWGVELGLLDMGRIDRAGGDTRAQGLNLSLVGKAPLGHAFGLFGKLGTTYGRTDNPVLADGRIDTRSDHGFGLSYGAGLSFNMTPRLSAVLEWDSNDFHFAGSGRDPVRSTSLGLQYRY
jgi:OOP family OmpA-OmpF porin